MKRWLVFFPLVMLIAVAASLVFTGFAAAEVAPSGCNGGVCHAWNTADNVYAGNHDTVYDANQWPNLLPDCKQGGCHTIISPVTGNPNLWVQHLGRTYTGSNGSAQTFACQTCHHSYQGAKLDKINIQAQIKAINTQCTGCHGPAAGVGHENFHNTTYIDNPPVDCSGCHPMVSPNTGQPNLWKWHIGRQTTTYNSGNGYANGMQCSGCHEYNGTKLNPANVANAIATGNTKCDACHTLHELDPNTKHRTQFLGDPAACTISGCHAPSRPPLDTQPNLQDFHVGKVTTSYQSGMTCDSCHNYVGDKLSKTTIDAAIASGNTACDACHNLQAGGHEPLHNTMYDSSKWPDLNPDCRSCHPMVSLNTGQPNLWKWHIGRQTTTYNAANGYAGGMVCQGCHNYSGTKLSKSAIDAAIVSGNKDCSACHGATHTNVEPSHDTAWIDNKPVNCITCHDGTSGQTGSSNLWPIHLGQQTTSFPSFMDCGSCHTYAGVKLNLADVSDAVRSGNTKCTACHAVTIHPMDPNTDHRTQFLGDPTFCTQSGCHAPSRPPQDTGGLNLQDFHVGKVTTSYSGGMTCDGCHDYSGNKLDKAKITTAIAKGGLKGGTPNTACDACHNVSGSTGHEVFHNTTYLDNPPVDCSSCHPMVSPNTGQPNLWAWHLNRQTTTYNSGNGYANGMQCAGCHGYTGTKLNPANVANAIATGNTKCDACHTLHELDPNTKHRTTFMGDPGACTVSGCHAPSRPPLDTQPNLQDFHVGKGTTSYSGGMTCDSCHNYQPGVGAQLVKVDIDAAIAGGNTACNACHKMIGAGGHEAQHMTLFDSSQTNAESLCSICHITDASKPAPHTLWDVHIGKKSTAYASMSCDTCHNYTGTKLSKPTVVNAIAARNKDCKACHTSLGVHAIDQNNTLPTSVHVGKACTACHARATSTVAKPVLPNSSLTTIPGTNICFTCHNSTGGAPNVQASFAKTYRHKTNKCASCHNAHVESKSTTAAPAADGSLKGTPGVAVTNGAAGTSPSFTLLSSVNNQYELCFKCHAVNSNNPNGGLPTGTKDKAVEFNTNNQSFHPVEGQGKNYGINSGAFVSGWSDGSKVYCTDCHGSDNAAEPKGPHGSSNAKILKKPVTPGVTGNSEQGGKVTSNELCFSCHSYAVYFQGAAGSRFSKHSYHVSSKSVPCATCHSAHGVSNKPHLIGGTKITSFTHTSSGGSCAASPCHSSKSYSHNYPHVTEPPPPPPPDDGGTGGTANVDEALWIDDLNGYTYSDGSGDRTYITSKMGDGSNSNSYDVEYKSGDHRVIALKVNSEASSYSKAVVRFYVTSVDSSPDSARIYAYQSNGTSLNTSSYVSHSVSGTGWKEVDVTTLAAKMNGYGWMKFRLVSVDRRHKISEAEFNLTAK